MDGYCPPEDDFLSHKGMHGSGENRDVLIEIIQWSYSQQPHHSTQMSCLIMRVPQHTSTVHSQVVGRGGPPCAGGSCKCVE
jgi:hypothetical protein